MFEFYDKCFERKGLSKEIAWNKKVYDSTTKQLHRKEKMQYKGKYFGQKRQGRHSVGKSNDKLSTLL